MKLCIQCQTEISSLDWKCNLCSFQPEWQDNFTLFHPELAADETGFKQVYFKQYAELQKNNFWFHGRNEMILWALNKHFPQMKNFLELGCGNGFVLSALAEKFSNCRFYGSDLSSTALKYSAELIKNADFFQMDATQIPFKNEFDVIGCFDLLEHLSADQQVLNQAFQALRPKGGLILTVPQHPALWSSHDEHLCHVRRYRRSEILSKVICAGFKPLYVTSFISLLLPLMWLSRKLNSKQTEFNPIEELSLSPTANKVLSYCLTFERILLKLGVNFPFGGSLLIIAYRP